MFKKYIGQESPGAQDAPEPARTESQAPAAAPSYSAGASSYSAPAPAAPAQTHRAPATGTRNVLSSDVEIKGTVKFTNDLVVDGKIEGEISSDGNLTVGENARIKAEVKTGTVIIYGKVHGNISVVDRVELRASAEVVGDIKAKTLVIEAGAIFVGKSTVGTPAAGATAPAKAEAKADAAKQDSLAGLNA